MDDTEYEPTQDPTDVMVEQHQLAQERAERVVSQRTESHDGSVTTEDISVQEACERL